VPGYTSARVKQILEEYCKYHQKGTYKHFWELKPEYRDNLAPPEDEEEEGEEEEKEKGGRKAQKQ
jgi:hypothetical protein